MIDDWPSESRTTALLITCDLAMSGNVSAHAETDNKQRLQEITREYVTEHHDNEDTFHGIEVQYVEIVEVGSGTPPRKMSQTELPTLFSQKL